MDFLCFVVGHVKYAVDITNLIGVVKDPLITTLPCMPIHMKGITKYRDMLIPVVDIAVMYRYETQVSPHHMIVFQGSTVFGVLVCQVNEIVRDDVPDGVLMMDSFDLERSIVVHNDTEGDTNDVKTVELF